MDDSRWRKSSKAETEREILADISDIGAISESTASHDAQEFRGQVTVTVRENPNVGTRRQNLGDGGFGRAFLRSQNGAHTNTFVGIGCQASFSTAIVRTVSAAPQPLTSAIMDLSNLSSSEQQAMSRIIEQKQMKDFLKLYTGLVERCFESCCNDFTSKALSSKEDTCVSNCIQKFLKHSERVGARFGEENAKMMAQQQNK